LIGTAEYDIINTTLVFSGMYTAITTSRPGARARYNMDIKTESDLTTGRE